MANTNQCKNMKIETNSRQSDIRDQRSTRPCPTCNFQPATCNARPQPSTTPPLQQPIFNTDGFWELTFSGQHALVPQHQGLFYVAYLLANPHAEPITAMDLTAEVFERFGEHEDFRPPIPNG